MHDIVIYIYHINQPNVGKYTIHGSYGFQIKTFVCCNVGTQIYGFITLFHIWGLFFVLIVSNHQTSKSMKTVSRSMKQSRISPRMISCLRPKSVFAKNLPTGSPTKQKGSNVNISTLHSLKLTAKAPKNDTFPISTSQDFQVVAPFSAYFQRACLPLAVLTNRERGLYPTWRAFEAPPAWGAKKGAKTSSLR